MAFIYNYSLKSINTFGIDVKATQFASFSDIESLRELLKLSANTNKLVIGGGSNLLFTSDFTGTVLQNSIKGIEVTSKDADNVYVKVGAGEIWHDLVMYCVTNNLQGIENLALIPGCVGAAPMQNIGAYGVELKDIFYELSAIEINTGNERKFSNQDCAFGYRESVFKNELKNKYVIVSVTLQLNSKPHYKISYGNLKEEIDKYGETNLSMATIAKAVISIRSSKLPDPKEIGNAGSFFKNPEILLSQFDELKINFPTIVGYPTTNDKIKVAAGWLIEQAGWKGKTFENKYGVHKNQALVLVNYGGANGQEILELSSKIIDSIFQKFGISLEREVNIY